MNDEERKKVVEVLVKWYKECHAEGPLFDLDTGEIKPGESK